MNRPGATLRAHGDLPLAGRNLGVLNVIVIITGLRTRRRPAVARFALRALHTYRRIPGVALLPALAPAPGA
jgi:hypothetical protein